MDIGKLSKQNIGNSGEYYLASILSAKNFVVTITLGRNEKYDLLAVNPKGKTLKISVKTRNLKNVKRFPMDVKNETIENKDFYYAFIRLNEFKEEPDFWIVPSDVVAMVLKTSHEKWLRIPNKEGGKHNDSDFRNFWIRQHKLYPKNWEHDLKQYYKNLKILEK
jgi:hypothetical protein